MLFLLRILGARDLFEQPLGPSGPLPTREETSSPMASMVIEKLLRDVAASHEYRSTQNDHFATTEALDRYQRGLIVYGFLSPISLQ